MFTVGAEPSATDKASAASASIFSSDTSVPASSAKEKAAVSATTEWLGIMDKGNYTEAWQAGAGYLRSLVKQAMFEQKMQTVRQPLGKLVSRTTARTFYRTKLPDTPAGEYVVIKFATVFENKPSTIETVTSMLATDGQWRVIGYFIKINETPATAPKGQP